MSVDRHLRVETDKPQRRAPCTCPAYRWPHRQGGGLCRWPDPPLSTHPTPAGTNKPTGARLRGVRRWLVKDQGLHPIRDRELIARVLPIMYQAVQRNQFLTVAETLEIVERV